MPTHAHSATRHKENLDQEVAITPLDIPELFAIIVSHVEPTALPSLVRVSRQFHKVCIPLLWQTVVLEADTANIWQADKGFRMGLIRHGRWIERLFLRSIDLQDGDLELLAETCTMLKLLDLTRTNITTETLRVLIHSDPYGVDPAPVAGSKRRRSVQSTSGDTDGELDPDLDTRMAKYRELILTETETEQEPDSQYESVGLEPSATDPSATESEHDQPIQRPRLHAPGRAPLRSHGSIPIHRLAGAARPAKFKGTSTQFPFHLETLILDNCSNLSGRSCLRLLSRLGPQLQSLSMNHVIDLGDQELIELMRHCPHLTELQMRGTEVTDELLLKVASDFNHIRDINVDMTVATDRGLVALAQGCPNLTTLSCHHNDEMTRALLEAFVEDLDAPGRQNRNAHTPNVVPQKIFRSNIVLTDIRLSFCPRLDDQGFQTLFRYATELQCVELDACSIQDGSLVILAETYRLRMARHGLVGPESRIQSRSGHEKGASNVRHGQGSKPFKIQGGLLYLSLHGCHRITNQGIRAIGRSCVGLQTLDIGNCPLLSLEVFVGPWEAVHLVNLVLSGMALTVQGLTEEQTLTLQQEEKAELEKCPLKTGNLAPSSLDELKSGDYDYIVCPMEEVVEQESGDEADSLPFNDDEEQPEQNTLVPANAASTSDSTIDMATRNTTHQRALLWNFYSILGQCRMLRQLDMSGVGFRIRVRDGLDQILPALQENLCVWNLNRGLSYKFTDEEVAWIGCHFGYGNTFDPRRDPEKEKQEQSRTRVAQLQVLTIFSHSLDDLVVPEIYDWLLDQGIREIDMEGMEDLDGEWDL